MVPAKTPTHPTIDVPFALEAPLEVIGLSTAYAAVLHVLERRYPIKPDHIWAEVAGGVMISLLPVALKARKAPQLNWRAYESAVWVSFAAAGMPIILWQLGEAVFRHAELLRYMIRRDASNTESYADDSTTLAGRGRARARAGDPLDGPGSPDAPAGPGRP